jgi:2-phospho-L-lactate guanylyltransferase
VKARPEQGTVAGFDAESRAGSVLRDDGTSVPFTAAAFDASGLRLLRAGQRVRIDRDGDGRVVRVTLVTLS